MNNTKVDIYSLRLINGDSVLCELIDNGFESDTNYFYTMVNPILVKTVDTKSGEIYAGRDYDPLTDDTVIEISVDSLLSQPCILSDYYRGFYVNTLFYSRFKKSRSNTYNDENTNTQEFNLKLQKANDELESYANELSLRFDVDVSLKTELYKESPEQTKSVLH